MKIIKANSTHSNQIIRYLSITCYWKEFVKGNTLDKSYEDFMLEWVILPRIPYTYVLVNDADEQNILGCLIAATTKELAEMPDYTPFLHTKVMEVFGAWFNFPIPDGVVLELFALDKSVRGKGFGSKFYDIVEQISIENNEKTISCFVWSCFPDSLITLTRKGLMIRDCIKFPSPIMIPLLYLEKKVEFTILKDYFQSSQYIKCENILLG